jgi:hypothetical protein
MWIKLASNNHLQAELLDPRRTILLFPRIAEFSVLKLHDLFLQGPKHQQFSTV